jgi:integrase
VKKSDVRAFYNSIIDRHIMQARSLENLHNCLKQMFQLCIDDQLIIVSPVDRAMDQINRAAQKKEKVQKNKAMTVREQELFLQYLNTHPDEERWKRMFTCLLGTGMRIGELLALVWEDIEWENNVIHVERNLTYYDHIGDENDGLTYYEIHLGKTETSRREIPMLDFVKSALVEEKEWQDNNNQHCSFQVDGYQDFIFFNRFGKPHEPGYMNRILNRLVRDCNDELLDKCPDEEPIHHLSCHAFRHTFVTRMLEQGVSPLVVQSIVGHKDVQTTVSIYWNVKKGYQLEQLGMEDIKSDNNVFYKALSKSSQQLDNTDFLNAYMPAKLRAAQIAKTIL